MFLFETFFDHCGHIIEMKINDGRCKVCMTFHQRVWSRPILHIKCHEINLAVNWRYRNKIWLDLMFLEHY